MRMHRVLLVVAAAVLLWPLRAAVADDVDIITSFSDFGPGSSQQFDHEDGDPWKGWADVTVTNTGTEPWTDFHFEIWDIGWSVENVDFVVDSPYEPTSSQGGLTWVVDNLAIGATLDLFFASSPVLPTQTANFRVYTDNTTNMVNFGLVIWPTAVPEPASGLLILLGLGGLTLRRGWS